MKQLFQNKKIDQNNLPLLDWETHVQQVKGFYTTHKSVIDSLVDRNKREEKTDREWLHAAHEIFEALIYDYALNRSSNKKIELSYNLAEA